MRTLPPHIKETEKREELSRIGHCHVVCDAHGSCQCVLRGGCVRGLMRKARARGRVRDEIRFEDCCCLHADCDARVRLWSKSEDDK